MSEIKIPGRDDLIVESVEISAPSDEEQDNSTIEGVQVTGRPDLVVTPVGGAEETVDTPWNSFWTGEGRTEFPDAPEFGDIPGSQRGGGLGESVKLLGAYLSTADEGELSRIIKKTVPGAKIKKDKFNNPMIRWRDTDYYVNRPGASGQDFASFAADVVKFLPVGKVASTLHGLSRYATLAVGSGLTQAASEVASEALGGDPKAGDIALRTGVAAVAPVVAEPLMRAVGAAIKGGWNLVTSKGELTSTARAVFKQNGVDPNDAPPEMLSAIQRFIEQTPKNTWRKIKGAAKDQQAKIDKEAKRVIAAAYARGRDAVTGIPKTRAQQTGDLTHWRNEQRMREGAYGGGPQQTMQDFDAKQADAIADAIQGVQQRVTGGQSVIAHETDAGQRIADIIGQKKGQITGEVDKLYTKARDAYSGPAQPIVGKEATQELPGRINQAVVDSDAILTSETTAANAAVKLLKDFSESSLIEAPGSGYRIRAVEATRRQLNGLQGQAKNASDKRVLGFIQREFDRWVGDHVKIPEMQAARAARTTQGRIFGEVTNDPIGNKARKTVDALAEGDVASKRSALNSILGVSKVDSKNLPTVKHILKYFPEAKNTLKEALVLRSVYAGSSNQSKGVGAQRMVNNINEALEGAGKEITEEVFDKTEIVVLKALRDDLKAIVPPANVPNPSGSAAAVADVIRKYAKIPWLAASLGATGEFVAAGALMARRALREEAPGPAARAVKGFRPRTPVNPLTGGIVGGAADQTSDVDPQGLLNALPQRLPF